MQFGCLFAANANVIKWYAINSCNDRLVVKQMKMSDTKIVIAT